MSALKLSFTLFVTSMFLVTRAHASSPSSPPCGGTEQDSQEIMKGVQAIARKAFPSIQLQARTCSSWGSKQVTQFASSRLPVDAHAILFAGEFVYHGMEEEEDKSFFKPFKNEQDAVEAARLLRAQPLLHEIFGEKKLFCQVGVDAPGSMAYTACSPADWKDRLWGMPSSESVREATDEALVFSRSLQPEQTPGDWSLIGYALRSSHIPVSAPGWKSARAHPAVSAFSKKHKDPWVEFFSWHQPYLIVRDAPKSKKAMTLRFGLRNRMAPDQVDIDAFRKGTEFYDSQGWQREATP